MTMTTTNPKADWQPSKPASDYDDAELKTTPIYLRLEALTGLPADKVLPFARDAIRDMWNQERLKRFAPAIEALFAAFDAAGEQVGDLVILARDGTFRAAKKAAASAAEGGRFKAADYAKFIGKGNGNPKAKHGGFVHEVAQAKNAGRNGVYELVIGPGISGNKVTTEFTAKLYQYPSNGQKLPVICYPPLSGERKEHRTGANLTQNDSIFEVASMSGMMKASILGHPQTPAVTFKLMDLVRKPGETPATTPTTAADVDEDEDEDEDVGNANAVLGGDDEFTTEE